MLEWTFYMVGLSDGNKYMVAATNIEEAVKKFNEVNGEMAKDVIITNISNTWIPVNNLIK